MYKEITIYDLARELNLSAATISRALKDHPAINKNTKKRIVEKAEELGYRSNNFASNLRRQKSHTIGVIVHELNSNFITSVLAGIEKVTTIANYDLIIGHSSELAGKEVANANNFFHKRVDGLIAALAFDTENMDHYEPFFERNIPVVFFDRVEEDSKGTKVIIDNFKAGYEATQHLIDQGCKRIIHTTSSLKRNVYAQRYKGYLAALKDNHIPFDESLLFVNDLKKESCIAFANQVAAMQPLPDGIFTTNDLTASLCIQVFKEKGIRVPEDIAVVGFNNDTISIIIEPKLTTVNYPGMDIGEVAATHLIKQLQGANGTNNTNSIVLKSELIIRESSLKKDKVQK
ncbi:LacI family DNA-binding transcriptional regulator [Ferruginibacter sp. SUN106]|uniref:LacI family DNA-binding transcriptional regulator n=1 Tax=Ferruginibacter sp. SUN106 TaxID=2978348 RepID=UPI003D35DE0D